jgi:hypothetical protein
MSQTTVCSRHKLDARFAFAHLAKDKSTNAVLFELTNDA